MKLWNDSYVHGLLLNHLLSSGIRTSVGIEGSGDEFMILERDGTITMNGETLTVAEAIAAKPSVEAMLNIITPCRHPSVMTVLDGNVWANSDQPDAPDMHLLLSDDLQRRIVAGLLLEEVLQEKMEFNLHRLWHDTSIGAFARARTATSPFNYISGAFGDGPWRNTWQLTGMLEEDSNWQDVLPEIIELVNVGRRLRGVRPFRLVSPLLRRIPIRIVLSVRF